MASLSEIVSLRKEFQVLYEQYKKDNSKLSDLKNIVINIEQKQKEYDIESNFVEAQKIVHDLLIEVPTEDLGTIENRKALNVASNMQALTDIMQPNNEKSIEFRLAGLLPGSAILMFDFVEKEIQGIEKIITVENTKTKITNLIKAASSLMEKNFTETKFKKFIKEAGVSDIDSYEIAKTLVKIIPESKDIADSVTISINNDSERVVLDLDKKNKINLVRSKKNIHDIVKPEDRTEIEGKLGIIEEWDYHKICIIDYERNSYTINYDPTKENIKMIKDNLGKSVKIIRERFPGDNRKWKLVKMISRGKMNED